jgi:hypothetical protein
VFTARYGLYLCVLCGSQNKLTALYNRYVSRIARLVGKRVLGMKCVFNFSAPNLLVQALSVSYSVYAHTNVCTSSCKVADTAVRF